MQLFASSFLAAAALALSVESAEALSTRLRARRTVGAGASAVETTTFVTGSLEYAKAKRAGLCASAGKTDGTKNPYKYVLDQCVMVKDVTMPQEYHGRMKAQMSLDICYDYCKNYKSFYMGLKNGDECWCANSYAPNTDFYGAHVCHVPCPGDKDEFCGGKKDEATAVYIIADVECEGRLPPDQGSKQVNKRIGKAEEELAKAVKQAKDENDADNKKVEVKAMEELDAAIYDVEEGRDIPKKKAGRIKEAKKAVEAAEEFYNKMESFDDRREPPGKIVDALDQLGKAKTALDAGDLAKAEEKMEIAIGRNMPTRAAVSPPPYVQDGRVSFKIPDKPDLYLMADPNLAGSPFKIKAAEWKGDESLVARLAFVGVPGEHAGDLKLAEPPPESFVFKGSEGILKDRALRARGPLIAAGGGGVFADQTKGACALFKEDVTFFFVEPENKPDPPNPFLYSLRSFNFPDRFLRHHPDGTVTLDRQPVGMTVAQEKEFTFEVVEAPPPMPLGVDLMVQGSIRAFHNAEHNQFMRMNKNEKMDASDKKAADALPKGWSWERFKVVEAGNGQVALFNPEQRRFVRMNDRKMDTNSPSEGPSAGPFDAKCYLKRYPDLRSAFGDDQGKAKDHYLRHGIKEGRDATCKGGKYNCKCYLNKYSDLRDAFKMQENDCDNQLFKGNKIALHSPHHNRFLRMRDNQDMDSNGPKAAKDLPDGWTWERFDVVDAGNGEVAFWCPIHKRFVRMHKTRMDGSDRKNSPNELPRDWTWERFKVVDAGNGQVAFHNRVHNRYIRIHKNGDADASSTRGSNELPTDWTWERFTVVVVDTPASRHWRTHGIGEKRVSGCTGGGDDCKCYLDRYSDLRKAGIDNCEKAYAHWQNHGKKEKRDWGCTAADALPKGWSWERFTVVDAGGGQIAFHNTEWNRFIRLSNAGVMDSSDKKAVEELPPPDKWTWERFTVVEG